MSVRVWHDANKPGTYAEGACDECASGVRILLRIVHGQSETIRQHQKALDRFAEQLRDAGIEPDWRAELFRQGIDCAPEQGALL